MIVFTINRFSSDVNMYLTGPSSVMESALFVQLCANMEGVAERAVSIFIDVSPGSAQSKWINERTQQLSTIQTL